MAETSLRHIEALVKEILEGKDLGDLLRHALEAALRAIMEAEVTDLAGAGYGEHSLERKAQRNGYRSRRFDTPLGSMELEVPKLRKGSYLPSFLSARQRSDDALRLAPLHIYPDRARAVHRRARVRPVDRCRTLVRGSSRLSRLTWR